MVLQLAGARYTHTLRHALSATDGNTCSLVSIRCPGNAATVVNDYANKPSLFPHYTLNVLWPTWACMWYTISYYSMLFLFLILISDRRLGLWEDPMQSAHLLHYSQTIMNWCRILSAHVHISWATLKCYELVLYNWTYYIKGYYI